MNNALTQLNVHSGRFNNLEVTVSGVTTRPVFPVEEEETGEHQRAEKLVVLNVSMDGAHQLKSIELNTGGSIQQMKEIVCAAFDAPCDATTALNCVTRENYPRGVQLNRAIVDALEAGDSIRLVVVGFLH